MISSWLITSSAELHPAAQHLLSSEALAQQRNPVQYRSLACLAVRCSASVPSRAVLCEMCGAVPWRVVCCTYTIILLKHNNWSAPPQLVSALSYMYTCS